MGSFIADKRPPDFPTAFYCIASDYFFIFFFFFFLTRIFRAEVMVAFGILCGNQRQRRERPRAIS
jgi:hypothetical protein